MICVLAAACGVATTVAWHRHREPARIVAALPTLPDLSEAPVALRERLIAAELAAHDRSRARHGVAALASLYHANGYSLAAARCWRLLATLEPHDPQPWYFLADLHLIAGDETGARTLLDHVATLAPDYAPVWLRLAEQDLKSGRSEAAANAYRRRLALLPGDAHAQLGLVRVSLQNEQPKEARTLLENLLRDHPDFPPALNLLAELLDAAGENVRATGLRVAGAEAGRFREAADPWRDALIDDCYDYDALCVRGMVDALTAHGDRGQGLFARAIRLRPDALAAYELLGNAQLDLDHVTDAIATYEDGLRRAAPTNPPAQYLVSLNRAYRRAGQPAAAVRVARDGLARLGDSPALQRALGNACREAGDARAAIAALQVAVNQAPGDAAALHELALALLEDRQLDAAVRALQQSHAANPQYPPTLTLLAQIEADSGRWENALTYLKPLYLARPDAEGAREKMAATHLQAGLAAERAGDRDAAERHYRAAAEFAPTQSEPVARLGVLLLLQEQFTAAVPPLERFHRLDGAGGRSALFLGRAYAGSGRPTEARRILEAGRVAALANGDTTTATRCREALANLETSLATP